MMMAAPRPPPMAPPITAPLLDLLLGVDDGDGVDGA
jgi:hypothetical protein